MTWDRARFDEVISLVERFCQSERCNTPIPGITLVRSDGPTAAIPAIYEPMLCLIAQGRKRTLLGDKLFEYGAGDYLIASVDLPISGEIVEASPDAPYLAFSLRLDTSIMAELLLALPDRPAVSRLPTGLTVSQPTPDLLDALARLLRLLDRPQDIAILAPLIEREILYHLLTGEQGQTLRQIALSESHLSQISRAISWIRRHYSDPLRIETVAQVANMSPSSFHRHFKAVTTMSPLQYQKQIRLQEARRLLLAQGTDAASVGFMVGYQSPSQFSREYARLFGHPPIRDVSRFHRIEPLQA
ncbi:AraC family transcriptional regulator [Modicisalibacter luteus]|uniref:AraC family transcriptional regulator N-terminal domain-containing protein n=1 Tax=Modicisalibacter luteus TaxID=453962 RepID=A0ABV7M665_9GAMM|nr:AraC family transcriptional regulator [Halomonas lutea]GHA99287.1 AraC family transcriptional regulator [Halomonas lutea]